MEKAALLKNAERSDCNEVETRGAMAKLRETDSEEAEARRKKAAEIAVALKAESKDLSKEKIKFCLRSKPCNLNTKRT